VILPIELIETHKNFLSLQFIWWGPTW